MILIAKNGFSMKYHFIIIAILFPAFFFGCKTNTVYVPVEAIQKEYIDKYHRDSIYLHDSIIIRTKGDTVFFEKYKYMFVDRILQDSIIKIDSIQVPYPVTEYVEVNKLNSLDRFQIWCGRIFLAIFLVYLFYRFKIK